MPLTPPSATARAIDTDLCNANSIESDTSDYSEDDEPEPEQSMLTATYYYLLGAIACLLSLAADALTFAAQRRYADHLATSNGYMASKGNLMTGDDVMIVDCGATKHCIPDASKLTKVTDPNPRHAVKVGHGERLEVIKIGEMQTKVVNTMTLVTRKGEVTMRYAVETMHLTNVLVVPDMACALFSCASAFKNDGIKTHLNSARRLVLPSGAYVVFSPSKRHYSISA